jgi:putative membrane protein
MHRISRQNPEIMTRHFYLKLGSAVLLCVATPIAVQAADPKATSSTGGPGAGTPAALPDAKPGAKSTLSKQDEQFIQTAGQAGMTEVKLGELASQKASSAQVKEFGAMMVKDHGKANQELQELAGKKGVTLPSELDAKYRGKVDKLSKLSGEAFDKEYASDMVSDHKKAVSDFEKASKSAADPDLKAWAGQTLPTLQGHLQHAQELKKGAK